MRQHQRQQLLKTTFRLRRNDLVLFEDKYINSEKGFSPILIVGILLMVGVFAFLFFFFGFNKQAENMVTSDIPPGVILDANGKICETQDAEFCHESVDVETWKDDGLP